MRLRRISQSVVESDHGHHLVPAGLFKYSVIFKNEGREFSFWVEFTAGTVRTRAVAVHINRPPLWADGSELSPEDFGQAVETIGGGFDLKGYEVTFSIAPRESPYVPAAIGILASEGGKWLDELSMDEELTDYQRDRLWCEALVQYEQANILRGS